MVDANGIVLTKEMIDAAATSGCGFTKRQIEAVGVQWPPVKGWKKQLVGKLVTAKQYSTFSKCQETTTPAESTDPVKEAAYHHAVAVWQAVEGRHRTRSVVAVERTRVAMDAVALAIKELEADTVQAIAMSRRPIARTEQPS
jgi:sialic acid synthase SpsE